MAKIDPMYSLVNTILDHKEVVIFLGGGASMEGKQGENRFPNFDELMDDVVKKFGHVPEDKGKRRDLFLSIIAKWEREKRLAVSLDEFLDGEPGAAHYYLAALSVALYGESNALFYLTTNFDDLMERAFMDLDRNSVRKFRTVTMPLRYNITGSEFAEMVNNIEMHLKSGRPVITKLFGDLHSQGPIFREEDFRLQPEVEKKIIEWLKKPMIVIGYSFSDKSLRELLMAARGTSPIFLINPSKKIPKSIKGLERVHHIKTRFSDFMADLFKVLTELSPSLIERAAKILSIIDPPPQLSGSRGNEASRQAIPVSKINEKNNGKESEVFQGSDRKRQKDGMGIGHFDSSIIKKRPIKVLFLASHPSKTSQIRREKEVNEIKNRLLNAKFLGQFELHAEWAVRYKDIRIAFLDYKPQIVHFIGNAYEVGLKVKDQAGNLISISPEVFSRLFELSSGHIDCVILNNSYDLAYVNAISQHINYVIGIGNNITEKAPMEFNLGFYDALGAGMSVEKAFQLGCNAVMSLFPDLPKHLIPILKKKQEVDNGSEQEEGTEGVESYIARPPYEFTVEELDRELIARGSAFPDNERFKFQDREGTVERETIMQKTKILYDSSSSWDLHEALREISTEELAKSLKFKTGKQELDGVKGIWESEEHIDFYQIEDQPAKNNADATAAIFMEENLVSTNNGFSILKVKQYGKTFNLCENELFYHQPVSVGRVFTGFLVGDDIIATAGHCVDEANVTRLRIVFGFKISDGAKAVTRFSNEKIYRGVKIIERIYNPKKATEDWALVKLDRKVTDRPVTRLAKRDVLLEQKLYVIGYPVGLPLKYGPGKVLALEDNYFLTDFDVYTGSSGSPVCDADSHEVVGMVVGGPDKNFRWTGNCYITVRYPNKNKESWTRCIGAGKLSEIVHRVIDINEQAEKNKLESDTSASFVHWENELRSAVKRGKYADGKNHLQKILSISPGRFDILNNEYGYIYNLDKPDEDEKNWEQNIEKIEWRRKVWKFAAKSNRFNFDMVVEDDGELIDDSDQEQTDINTSIPNDNREGKTSGQLGAELEVPVLELFGKFLEMCNEEFEIGNVKKRRRQPSGFQFGYDLEFACRIEGDKKLKLRVECKNYSDKIELGDLTGKLATVKLDHDKDPIDHWIVIAPFASIPVDLNRCLNSWETTNEYPFKVQVWNQKDYNVDRFFALVPDIYDLFFKPEKGCEHPKNWNRKQKADNLKSWQEKLEPPLRLPKGWTDYLDINKPAKLQLERKEKIFEQRFRTTNYVSMNCKEVTGSIMPQPLEDKIYRWLEEPVSQSPVLFLLGEFGSGKTFFTYVLTRKLVEKFRQSPKNGWIPIRFALKNIGENFNPEHPNHIQDYIQHRLNNFGAHIEGWNGLQDRGFKFLAILDGFDEISKELDPATIQRNIDILISLYDSDYFADTKLLITSRKHFFEMQREKERLMDKLGKPQLLHLSPFSRREASDHLEKYAGEVGQKDKFHMVKECYDAIGMACKPLFLEMVESSLDELTDEPLSEYILYEKYIDRSLKRKESLLYDKKKDTLWEELTENLKRGLELVALALYRSTDKVEYVYLSDVKKARHQLQNWLWTLTEPDAAVVEDETSRIAVRSLLERVDVSNQPVGKKWPVDFCHRSIREYFVARAVCNMLENNLEEAEDFLKAHFLSHEIIFFAGEIMNRRPDGCGAYENHLKTLIEKTRHVKETARLSLGNLGGNAVNLLYQYKQGELPAFDWTYLVLDGAILPDADLSGRDFNHTSLRFANLDNVNFSGADFSYCDLTEVRLEETTPVQSIAVGADENILALYNNGVIRQWGHMPGKRPNAVNLSGGIEEKEMKLMALPGNDLTILHDTFLYFYERRENELTQKAKIEINTDIQLLHLSRQFLLLKKMEGEYDRFHLVDLMQSSVIKSMVCPPFSICHLLERHAIITYNETEGLRLMDLTQANRTTRIISISETVSCLAVCRCDENESCYYMGLGLFTGGLQLWQVDVNEWKAWKLSEHMVHQPKSPVKDISFMGLDRVVTGGLDKTIRLFPFDKEGRQAGSIEEFKMTPQCSSMKLDGVERDKVEGQKLRELRDNAEKVKI